MPAFSVRLTQPSGEDYLHDDITLMASLQRPGSRRPARPPAPEMPPPPPVPMRVHARRERPPPPTCRRPASGHIEELKANGEGELLGGHAQGHQPGGVAVGQPARVRAILAALRQLPRRITAPKAPLNERAELVSEPIAIQVGRMVQGREGGARTLRPISQTPGAPAAAARRLSAAAGARHRPPPPTARRPPASPVLPVAPA